MLDAAELLVSALSALDELLELPQATSPTDIAATRSMAILFFILFFLL